MKLKTLLTWILGLGTGVWLMAPARTPEPKTPVQITVTLEWNMFERCIDNWVASGPEETWPIGGVKLVAVPTTAFCDN